MANQTSINRRQSISSSDIFIDDSTEDDTTTQTDGRSAQLRNSTQNQDGSSAPIDRSPDVHSQKKTKPSFFDRFRSPEEIKRNQKHEQVLEAIKAYGSINKELKVLNGKLESMIQLLTVATGGGNKSLLVAALDEAKVLMDQHNQLIPTFSRYPVTAQLAVNEVTAYATSRKKVVDKYSVVTELAQNTFNRSSAVEKQLEEAKLQWKRLVHVDTAIRAKHAQLETAINPPSNINVDGSGSASDPEEDD